MAIDVNELSDEDFLKALEEAEYADLSDESEEEDLEGTSTEVSDEAENDDEDQENGSEDNDDEDAENSENDDEDTDQEDEESEEDLDNVETTKADDGESDEETTGAEDNTDDDSTEENTQVKDGDTDTETKQKNDDDSAETDEVDYKKQYEELAAKAEKLQAFHDEVTGEFTANGKKVKGFADPKKIIQAQQMAYGYSDKMAAFKKYRPLMGPIKERGLLEDPEKFNLMMDLYDGNVEALKAHIKTLNLDPMELDMDTIQYNHGNHMTSPMELAFNDVIDNAANSGVKDQIERVVREQWDTESVVELLKSPEASADLIDHVGSGVFEAVNDRIMEKKASDVLGTFAVKPAIVQYREALAELNAEYANYEQSQNAAAEAEKAKAIEAEKIRIENERKAAEYKTKAEQEKLKADKARSKATTASRKKKAVVKPTKVVLDPMELSDEELTKLVDGFIAG